MKLSKQKTAEREDDFFHKPYLYKDTDLLPPRFFVSLQKI